MTCALCEAGTTIFGSRPSRDLARSQRRMTLGPLPQRRRDREQLAQLGTRRMLPSLGGRISQARERSAQRIEESGGGHASIFLVRTYVR